MSKLALYCRVSTDTQESDNQLLELRQWAESKGHAVVAEYVDVASCARRRDSALSTTLAGTRRRTQFPNNVAASAKRWTPTARGVGLIIANGPPVCNRVHRDVCTGQKVVHLTYPISNLRCLLVQEILDMLIPRSGDRNRGQCRLFLEGN